MQESRRLGATISAPPPVHALARSADYSQRLIAWTEPRTQKCAMAMCRPNFSGTFSSIYFPGD